MTDLSTDHIITELRRLWTNASEASLPDDMAQARELVKRLPSHRTDEGEAFLVAMVRLDHWLRG